MHDSPIAIVGHSYRAPGVGGKGLWEYLAEAKSAWSRVPEDRFQEDAYFYSDKDKAGTFSSKGAHFLPDDVYAFDASFFNIRPDEAKAMDPHHRMMLECAWEATEMAGIGVNDLAGRNIGVFAAIGSPEYGQQMAEDLPSTTTFAATGSAPCMYANRLSYFFDLAGPSIAFDAACASSSYAVHVACQSLRAGECDAAFVGGTALLLGPNQWVLLDNMGALSPEGKSFSYDAKASGFGRGEGGACLLIKRLDDAIKAGDPIQAIIRNSACGHSGRSEGITMPRQSAQEQLLWRVHNDIGLSPSHTPVVEGHGTGTQAGDPIEAGAFANVLARDRSPSNPLYIGSLKSNFGHLEGASGILAIVKAILMIQRGTILPTANFQEMNNKIKGADKLRVTQKVVPWPVNELRRVCVTNFGFGGSNAVVLLEEAPKAAITNGSTNGIATKNGSCIINGHSDSHTNGNGVVNGNGATTIRKGLSMNGTESSNGILKPEYSDKLAEQNRLFVLSAKSESSLTSYIKSLTRFLDTAPPSNEFVRDLGFTLAQRRTHHSFRHAVTADSVSNLKDQLANIKVTKSRPRIIAFVFTGQGAQHAQMATGLSHYQPFAAAIDQAEVHLREMGARWSLKEELSKPSSESRINDAEISQPVCTAVQLALVTLLKSWDITPSTVTGHSSGEIAAAYAAGIVSFRAAIAIAYFRGQVAAQVEHGQQGPQGAMLALGASAEVATQLLHEISAGYATIAAINSPQSVTVSGDEPAITAIQEIAEERGVFARKLKVKVAYHSQHLESTAATYLAAIKSFCNEESSITLHENSKVKFVSSVIGGVTSKDHVGASYWVKNLLQPVRFLEAVESVLTKQNEDTDISVPNVILEIGPHSALKGPIKQIVDGLRQRNEQRQAQAPFSYVPSLVRGEKSAESLINLAGTLFCLGASPRLDVVNQVDLHQVRVLSDLPPYVWDKSVRYIHRPRYTQARLNPNQPYNQLVGWKSPYTEGGEHAFRQVFTLDEMPWVRDHAVAGQVIFPMTGYLSLAMEALRKINPVVPEAILMREFHAKRSLEINEDERVDITTKLRPANTGTETFSSSVWSFEVLTWSEEAGWTTHCYGQIEAESSELSQLTPTFKAAKPLIRADALEERSTGDEYSSQGQGGTIYGPAFRSMVKLWECPGYTVLETQLREMDISQSSPYGSIITIDPPTLDGFLQGFGPFQEVDGKRYMHMPNYVSRVRISNKIPASDRQRFTSVTRLLSRDVKAGSLKISVASFAHRPDGSLLPVAEWESVAFRAIGSSDSEEIAAGLPTSYYWDMIPSLDHVTDEKRARILAVEPFGESDLEPPRVLNREAVYFMDKALNETSGVDYSKLPSHLAKFVEWAKGIVTQKKLEWNGKAELQPDAPMTAQLEMLRKIGEQLPAIIRQEVQPLEIMLKDGLLARNYEADAPNARLSRLLARYVRHLSDVKADLRVIEIGGGTGSATLPVMEALSRDSEDLPAFLTYTFTDISAGFFENARTKLAKWAERITFKKLDIGQDLVQQGFSLEDYDLVIASNVLHATPNMAVTIDNVRSLLRPNGKLLLLEGIHHPALTLPFALLPGWWLTDDEYRSGEEGPLLSVAAWDRLLSDRGFSGVDSSIDGFPGSVENMNSMISSTRIGIQDDSSTTAPITICGPLMDDEEAEFAEMVAEQVAELLDCSTSVKPFAEIDATDDPYCIFIDSPRHSVLNDVSSETFEAIKNILLETQGVLWVVPDGHPVDAITIKGMLRTLRLENESKNLLLFEDAPCSFDGAGAIAKLVKRLRDSELASNLDRDFVWSNGMVQLPRFRKLTAAKESFAHEAGAPLRKVQKIWQKDTSLEMTVDSAGSLDSIYFRRTEVLKQPLSDDDVLIQVEAVGVNFRDLLLVLGSIPWTSPGFEGAGVVVRVGSRVTDLKAGDRVFYGSLGGGSFTTHVRMPYWRASKLPDGISSADAASIPVAYSTAVMSLIRIGRLRKGESVLIHAASGAVGQACIVLAKHIGARIFATAGSEAKRGFLHDTFDIPKENIFSSRTPDFRDGILSATDGQGVDVIVNSLSGNLLQETWSLIADFGRFVEIGKRDLLQNVHLGMRPFDRNVSFSGVDLRAYFEKRPEELRELLAEVVDLLTRGIIVPIQPVTALPISQLATGLRRLQSGKNIGKIVVTMGSEEQVLAECRPPPALTSSQLLRHDATYLITGGTGGIGLDLGSWMLDNGASNVVLLGRSGSTRPEVKKLLIRYEGSAKTVRAVACDVGVRDDLANALKSIDDLPPVRGVIHGALFLRDAVFSNATYEDWQDITRPRVQGSWNLHELLPGNLDFFIALSSFLGSTGNMGQSIYAGTSTFFDAFATYRNSHGQPSVSIALPVVLDVGYVADRDLTEKLSNTLGAILSGAQLHTLIKGAIIGPSSGLNYNGRAISFSFSSAEDDTLPWQCFHPKALVQLVNAKLQGPATNSQGRGGSANSTGLWVIVEGDPTLGLLEALMSKVSSITMIDQDEVEPDTPLSAYSLDSLVSVELRNWIRRETRVELALPKIVGSANLRALATHILSQREVKK